MKMLEIIQVNKSIPNRTKSNLFYFKDLRPPSNIYENAPPALMSMPMSHYDNNNQHDDYGNNINTTIEPPFDLNMVANDISYYDLPAGLMCLLVKVKIYLKIMFFMS
jgi:hypothetical protein